MDPTKKGKMENAQGVISLEYEPTVVSIVVKKSIRFMFNLKDKIPI